MVKVVIKDNTGFKHVNIGDILILDEDYYYNSQRCYYIDLLDKPIEKRGRVLFDETFVNKNMGILFEREK